MVLQRVNSETLAVKVGQSVVQLKSVGALKINDHIIEGPGEYDVAGVGAHVLESVAIIFAEGIRTAAVWQNGMKLGDDNIDIDIIVFLHNDAKAINDAIKELEPRIVVLSDEDTASEIAKQDGLELTRESNYKVTTQSLPTTGTAFILLQ